MEGIPNSEALVMMGRVEGKVDTLITMQSAVNARVDALEVRVSKGEVAMASLSSSIEASSKTNQSIFSNVVSVIATAIAVATAYMSLK